MKRSERKAAHSDVYEAKCRHKQACYFRKYAQSVFDSCDKSITSLEYSEKMGHSEFLLVRKNLAILASAFEKGQNLRVAKENCKCLFAEYQVALRAYQIACKK